MSPSNLQVFCVRPDPIAVIFQLYVLASGNQECHPEVISEEYEPKAPLTEVKQ